jgi:Na+/H+ antiporter NhaD/arsenite permease-like protein
MLGTSAVASSVTDNIPLAAMLARILDADPTIGGNPDSPFWWSVVFGANLGGNLTPIGSASTLVAVTVMHKHNLAIGFVGFIKTALPFAVMQIVLAVLYLLLLGVLG